MLLVLTHFYDPTCGRITISLLITIAFVAATSGSMIYPTQQSPLVDILIGGLGAALGAVVAHWLGVDNKRRQPPEDEEPPSQ